MATSSERSPPPFPDSEDQDLCEDVRLSDSDDDGEDIFLNAPDPPLTKMDTVPPADGIATSQPKLSPEPPADLLNDPLSEPVVSQSESQPVSEVIAEVTSEPSDDFVDLTDNDTEAPGDAVAAEGALAEAVKDISEMPSDEPPEDDLLSEPVSQTENEPAAEILSEPSDDFVDLLGNETEAPGEETVEAAPDGAEAPGSISDSADDDISSSEEEQETEEASSAPVMDIFSDLVDVTQPPISGDLADISQPPVSSDLADVKLSSDLADVTLSSDLADVTLSSDLADVPLSSDLADVTLSSDLADVTPSSDLADVTPSSDLVDTTQPPVSSELADVTPSSDLADVTLASDLAEVTPSSDLADVTPSSDLADTTQPPVSSDLADMTLSNDLADVTPSSDVADITQPPVSSDLADITQPPDSSDLADITQPPVSSDLADITQPPDSSDLADITQPPDSSDLADIKQPPINEILTDPLVNVVSAPPPAPVQKPSKPPIDLFEDEQSDLFMEPRQAKSTKQPQTSIFDEPDEDLFSEPLGATLTKSTDVINSEQKDKSVTAKSEVVSGPLSDDFREDPTDIFTEEAVVTAPTAASASSINTKTNGVHSEEEEPDIFAEATVELSLDSPRSDRKKPAAAKPAVSAAPTLSAAASVSKPQPATATLEELEEDEQEDKFELNISITNPEKIGDGMNAYMAYKVSTQTTLPMFRSKTFTVRRRFSDFLGLYEKLSEKHSQSGFIVPPPPEKSILGMTKVKVGKEDPSSAEFVERRRAALERYLQRVVCHPSLIQDPDVREFLEREELPRAVNTQALSGAGFLKMISKATDAVSKMTIKMNESDVWFEEKLQEVESEDQQFRKLLGMVDSLVSHRKELSLNTASFAKSVAMLGSSEDNTALSRALSQLAEVEDKMEQLHQEQASNDSFNFAELLADYIRLLGSVRGSFDHRMKSWQRWQDAQNMLQKKRETEAKLLWANKPDKLQQAKEDISEWEAKVTQSERDFDRVSATVRKEVLRFEKEKARDFKRQIIKYLESLLQSQQQLMKYWEAFLPEAKAIA